MPIQNFHFSHILEYCNIINDAQGSNNDYRWPSIDGTFLKQLIFKQGEIERFSGRILRICTPKCTPVSHFQCLYVNPKLSRDQKIILHRPYLNKKGIKC
jgi:hypothetical protein